MTPSENKNNYRAPILCKCGCGGEIVFQPHHKYYGIPQFISGHNNKGKQFSENARENISLGKMGNKNPNYRKFGHLHPNWKGGTSILSIQIRSLDKMRSWRYSIFKRDHFTCQYCSQIGGKLNAHHVKPLYIILNINNINIIYQAIQCNELWDLNNGITLCEKCHNKIPKKYYNGEK